jgi:antimicrobial peptide system SdpB family protein
VLSAIGSAALRWTAASPFTNAYGLARTILALGTAGTIGLTAPSSIYRPARGMLDAPYCSDLPRITPYCLVPRDQLWIAQVISVVVLLVVASGWRPRLTGIPHWWVSFGLATTATLPDGGDQVAQVLTLLLIPVTLADPRRWHWDPAPSPRPHAALIALVALTLVRVQVSAIYFHSSLAKLGVPEWVDGTAFWYWATEPSFGPPMWLRPFVLAIVREPLGVAALTWGPILLEFSLALALVMDRRARLWLLGPGIAFHAMIALLMGLVSFALAMIAALLLYLWPVQRPIDLRPLARWARQALARPHVIRREEAPVSVAR